MSNRVIVIGLDGVSWNVLDPILKEDLMLNLKSLKEDSIYGELESCVPPVTFPAWKCYSTGKDPSQLGVYWWMNLDFKHKKFILNSSLSFKGKDIWDYLSEKSLKSIVINMPGTYPARKINGILIAGPPNPSLRKSVYPKELFEKLVRINYKNMPEAKWSIEGLKVIKECRIIHKQQCKLALELMEKKSWDFFHFTFVLTDPILHHFWNHHKDLLDSDNKITEELRKFWRDIDYFIGKFIEKASEDDYIFIISDHGMVKMDYKFYLNNFLEQEGYLKLKWKSYIRDRMISYLPKRKVGELFSKIHMMKPTSKILQLLGLLDKFNPTKDIELNEELINWKKTKAICLSDASALIYTNNMNENEKYELFDLLKSFKHNDKKVFEKVCYASKIYENIQENSPNIIAIPRRGYEIAPGIGKKVFKSSREDIWRSTHKVGGMFLVRGADLKFKTKNTTIYDVAPTILSLLDFPDVEFMNEMKGRILNNLGRD